MKKTLKSALSLLLCCVILLAFAACKKTDAPPATTTPPAGGATATPDAPSGGGDAPPAEPPAASQRDSLSVAISQDSGSLDPQKLGGGASFKNVSRMYAEPLFDLDANGDKVWLLATSIDITSPTQWVIHLREGVKFTNGNPFTAEDVMFSIDKNNNDPEMPPTFPALNWEACRIIDDYTVELNFNIYDLTTASNMPTVQIYDVESWVDTETYSRNPIGTGQYIVTEYVINSHCNLTANENYWGNAAKIKNLQFKVINEPAQIVTALEVGTVDVATIPISDIDYVKSLPGFTVTTMSSSAVDCLWFNTTPSSVFESHDARKAVVYSIDKQAINSLVYYGYATTPSWPLPETFVDFKPEYANMDDTYAIGRDLDRAKEYAEKAGVVGANVRLATNGSTEATTIAEILQQNMKEAGINATITNYDMATWNSIVFDPSMYDLFIWGMTVPSYTSSQCYYGWFTYLDCFNKGTWEGLSRFAELSSVVQNTYDDTERAAMTKELTEILTRESFWYAMDEPQMAIAYRDDLQGVEFMLMFNAYYGNWY
jgi:peptide/nickel transport system substrate-binding protein